MKHKTVLYWSLSAVLYVALVIGGYNVYASWDNTAPDAESDHRHGNEHSHGTAHEGHGDASAASEVNVQIGYTDQVMTIELKTAANDAPELEVHHEKTMHLIVISADLQDYRHLHPEEKGNGVYEQRIALKPQTYKVFVDIKPAGLAYAAAPIELSVGEGRAAHSHNRLQADSEQTRTVNGRTVALTIDSLVAGQPATLTFDIKDGTPEPYLGALGHVVIVDEAAEQFIHVHPVSDEATAFRTVFDSPGRYKLWGEFQLDGQVHVYPFVIEVK